MIVIKIYNLLHVHTSSKRTYFSTKFYYFIQIAKYIYNYYMTIYDALILYMHICSISKFLIADEIFIYSNINVKNILKILFIM